MPATLVTFVLTWVLVALALSGGIVLGLSLRILDGWVLTYLWTWFMLPLGMKPLNIPIAIGIAMVAGMLTSRSSSSSKDEKKGMILLGHVLGSLLTLLMGYIVHQFM